MKTRIAVSFAAALAAISLNAAPVAVDAQAKGTPLEHYWSFGVGAYPNAEIHITEWSTSPNSRDVLHDNLPPAAYIAKVSLENVGKVNSLMYWTFTDIFEEKGGGRDIFHGGFGMLNFQGIAKPSYHAYRMMNALGDELLWNSDNVTVTRDSKRGKCAALKAAGDATKREIVRADSSGRLVLRRTLSPWSLVLVREL